MPTILVKFYILDFEVLEADPFDISINLFNIKSIEQVASNNHDYNGIDTAMLNLAPINPCAPIQSCSYHPIRMVGRGGMFDQVDYHDYTVDLIDNHGNA